MPWPLVPKTVRRGTLGLGCLVALLLPAASSDAGRERTDANHARASAANAIHARASAANAIAGEVQVANEPASGWQVDLYAAGRNAARHLAGTSTDSGGRFRFGHVPSPPDSILYLVARRGDAHKLLAVIGTRRELPERVVINELVTVASVWTSAQLLDGEELHGNAIGLLSAARNVPNLVDLASGGPGVVVQNATNGTRTTTLATLNTLASILSDCLRAGCRTFFALSTPPGEDPPGDTLEALQYVATNPWHNVNEIFRLRPPARDGESDTAPAFLPTLLWPPTGWTLSLVYAEGGFNAPGGLSVDARGSVWANNNFVPGSQSILANGAGPPHRGPIAYSGTGVTHLASNGRPLSPPTGYLGGGTFGAAFGIAIDRRGHVWIGNFTGDSVSELASDGTPISPDSDSPYSSSGGYEHPSFHDPQSIIVDRAGSIWVANLHGNTVSALVGGNPRLVSVYGEGCGDAGFRLPWGLASDSRGRIWVSNFGGNSASVIDPTRRSSCPAATYPLGRSDALSEPEGIAVDSLDNVWVARTGASRVTLLEAAKGYMGPIHFDAERTIVGPWGIAVDGRDNVWVADFFGKRLTHLCGAAGNCPQGLATGDPISPTGNPDDQGVLREGGYGVNGALQSVTSVVVDQAGNVWLANNFDDDEVCLLGAGVPRAGSRNTPILERLQPRCGGNGAVVVFGVAAPVAAPLIGPPRQP